MMKIKRIHPVWIKYPLLYYLIFELSLCLLLYAGLKNFSEAFQDGGVRVQLLSEVQSIRPGQRFSVALHITPDDNWHTYWKNPGDSGLPTNIEWDLPYGFTAGELQWPLPQIFKTPTAVSFGYEEEILLITEIKAPEAIKSGSKITLSASVDWLACKDGCVPGHADLSIVLPVKNKKPKIDTRWVDYFAKARENLPKTPLDWKIKAFVKNNNIVIQAILPSGSKTELKKVTFFPEQRGLIEFSEFLKSEKEASPTAVLLDSDGEVGKLYGAKTTPHMFIINSDGILVYDGAIDDKPSTNIEDIETAKNYVQEAMEEVLAGKKVSIPITKPYGCTVKYK